ncbi:MAG: substrate-binding domain-containing protein [Gammaproteobacteria bacterium]
MVRKAFDDMTAFGAIRGLHEAGIPVPGECSVIGFDDIDVAEFYNPPLTTIRQPMPEMGKEAARILRRAIRARRASQEPAQTRLSLEPDLVIRATTAPPPPE